MDDSMSANSASKPYKHACESCRGYKLRCAIESVEATGKCSRCLGANAECVFEPLAPRQRRKRTDARVTSLEKELRAMKSMLDGLRDSQLAESKEASVSSRAASTPTIYLDTRDSLIPDAVSDDLAEVLLKEFLDHLIPQYPVVVISESFDSLRVSKPLLALAAITAASSTREQSLFRMLHSHLVRQITERAVIEGDRSVELIQSILILETWYCPPDDLRRLNFYQWIHIAGTMALQLGLGGRRSLQEPDLSKFTFEQRRTMFAVFQSCSAVAVTLRRQCLVTFTSTSQKVLDDFEFSTTSVHDKRLVAWVKLQVIADDIENNKSHEAGFDLVGLLDKFDWWERGLQDGVMNASLNVHLHYCKSKLFESIMNVDHDSEELVPPFLSGPSHRATPNAAINPLYIRAILGLVSTCRSILDAVIFMDDSVLRGCPTVTFVKILHALKVLSMLKRARTHSDHTIWHVIDESSLNTEAYTASICDKLDAAAGSMKCRVPSMILSVARKSAAQAIGAESSRPETNSSYNVTTDLLRSTENRQQEPIFVDSGLLEPTVLPQPIPSGSLPSTFGANTFDTQVPPDMMGLSDFEGMIMPDFGLEFGNFDGFNDWDGQNSGVNQIL